VPYIHENPIGPGHPRRSPGHGRIGIPRRGRRPSGAHPAHCRLSRWLVGRRWSYARANLPTWPFRAKWRSALRRVWRWLEPRRGRWSAAHVSSARWPAVRAYRRHWRPTVRPRAGTGVPTRRRPAGHGRQAGTADAEMRRLTHNAAAKGSAYAWQVSPARRIWAGRRLPVGVRAGSSFGVYPAGGTFDLAISQVTAFPCVCRSDNMGTRRCSCRLGSLAARRFAPVVRLALRNMLSGAGDSSWLSFP
jgi:hypothetical protein